VIPFDSLRGRTSLHGAPPASILVPRSFLEVYTRNVTNQPARFVADRSGDILDVAGSRGT
jgi:hypothetical protein